MTRELSKEQAEAVNSINGQTLLVSCPGSGKTTVIIERCKKMIESGIDPNSVLNLTFTKAAAEEMKNRFEKEIGSKSAMYFGTIHAFCYKVLQSEGMVSRDSILKESEKWMFIAGLMQGKIAPNEMEETVKGIMSEISFVKNKEIPLLQYEPETISKNDFEDVFSKYEDYKMSEGKIDFDDMLIYCRDVFLSNKVILEKYKQIYKYITVDEYQDVNRIQAQICYMLAGRNGNLFVVGDDDQSIYRFRAADSNIMLDFPKQFPDCKTINLGLNYRSGKKIIRLASRLINRNQVRFRKDFLVSRDTEGLVETMSYDCATAEAISIIKKIKEKKQQGIPYREMAALYRNNNLNLQLTVQLMKEDIPFYSTEKIKSIHQEFIYDDIIMYYRLSKQQSKKGDVRKVLNRPSRYIKSETFKDCLFEKESLFKACDRIIDANRRQSAKDKIMDMYFDVTQLGKIQKPTEFIDYLSHTMGYRSWLAEYAAYRGKEAEDYEIILDDLREEAQLFDTMEDWIAFVVRYEKRIEEAQKNKNEDAVTLSTFHSSKGLEWKIVFLIQANDGICPFGKAELPEELEEERRMFYVAMTRAKDELYMSFIEGTNKSKGASQYFQEIGISIENIKFPFSKEAPGQRTMDEVMGLGKELCGPVETFKRNAYAHTSEKERSK